MPKHNASSRAEPDVSLLRACPDDRILQDCRWEAFRASGPGGQKRNKTSSAIRLVHAPTNIAAIANESRSQAENRKSALRRLRHRMTIELRETIPADGFVLPSWFQSLCPAGKLEVSRRHEMYLPAMGLILDVLAVCRWSVSEAAKILALSTSNLVKFLQNDEKLMARVNEMRLIAGFKPLGTG